MKQCSRWDDDGTCYAITLEDLKEQPFRLVQRIRMTQDDTIDFSSIPSRIQRILPMAARSLEIWESVNKQAPRHWRAHPTFEVKPGLAQVVVTLIYCIHYSRERSEKLKVIILS